MTTPRTTIKFDDVVVKLDTGTELNLQRCGLCRSLVLPNDVQEHANWHGDLTRGVQVAGLGFGGVGIVGGVL